MKKTLVALAALAATASFAQSSVTISGNLDVAYASKTGTVAGANGSTITTTDGNSSTSNIKFTAVEDLGGGMKATVQLELDPRGIFNDGAIQTFTANESVTTAGTSVETKSTLKVLGTHEVFLGLSGAFGNLQLGQPNSFGLTTAGASSPLGTGIGSGYTYNGATNSGWSGISVTRYTRALKYTSPDMNGFTVGVQYAPGNDQTRVNLSTALNIPNNRQATEIGVNYSKGNLNVSYANVQQGAQTNATGYYAVGTASLVATNANVFGANYKFGNLTAYAGAGNGTKFTGAASAVTQSNSRYALKFSMGNADLIGQYTQTESAGVTGKVTGLRADYIMSKTAAAYIGSESYDSGSNTNMNIVSVGLRKSF